MGERVLSFWHREIGMQILQQPITRLLCAALARCCAKSARKNIKNNCASCTSGKAAEITASIKTQGRTYVSEANEGHSCNLYTLQD